MDSIVSEYPNNFANVLQQIIISEEHGMQKNQKRLEQNSALLIYYF